MAARMHDAWVGKVGCMSQHADSACVPAKPHDTAVHFRGSERQWKGQCATTRRQRAGNHALRRL